MSEVRPRTSREDASFWGQGKLRIHGGPSSRESASSKLDANSRLNRPIDGWQFDLAVAQEPGTLLPDGCREVEAVKVHDFVPGPDEVLDKLPVRIRTSVDLRQRAELGV